MKEMSHNDRICGGVAASTFGVEHLSNRLDEAFANNSNYEVQFDDLQTYFLFSFDGEPVCPEHITISHEHSGREWVIANSEGLTIWGLCSKTAEWFLHLLAEEFNYNLICQ